MIHGRLPPQRSDKGLVRFPRGEPEPPGPMVRRQATPEERERYGIGSTIDEREEKTVGSVSEISEFVSEIQEIAPEIQEIIPDSRESVPAPAQERREPVAPPGRGRRLSESIQRQIREMAADGAVAADIARVLGLKTQTVAYHMSKKPPTPRLTQKAAATSMSSGIVQQAQAPYGPPLPEILMALLRDVPSQISLQDQAWLRREDWLGLWNAAIRYCFPTSTSGGRSDE